QRIRRCGPNATFRTRLQQCEGDWWPLSPRCYRVAHAARLRTDTEFCDTVRLEHDPEKWIPVFGKRSCSSKKVERDDESKRSHLALGTVHERRRSSALE